MKLKLQFQEFWIRNNISFLYRFWSTAHQALEKVNETPGTFREFQVNQTEPNYVENVILGHKEQHCYSGVLLAYASLDEFMFILTTDLGKFLRVNVEPSDLKDQGVRRYRTYVQKACAIPDDEISVDWVFLADLAVVRNAIIHANGNKSLLSNPKELERVVNKHSNQLSFKHTAKLVVSAEFVELCINTTQETALAINKFMVDKL